MLENYQEYHSFPNRQQDQRKGRRETAKLAEERKMQKSKARVHQLSGNQSECYNNILAN